jgi:hypothetical protein
MRITGNFVPKAVANFTSGSVPYIDPNGNLTEDNVNLFWDDGNTCLGIGTNTPHSILGGSGLAVKASNIMVTDATVKMRIAQDSSGGYIGTTSNHRLFIQTNGTEVGRITSGGLWGVSTNGDANNTLVVGGSGGSNAGFEFAVTTAIVSQAFNRNTSAYATYDLDGAVINIRPGGSTAKQWQVDANGNLIPSNAALATNATNGFFYMQSCPGIASGTPTSNTGRVATVIDTTNLGLGAYSGSWQWLYFPHTGRSTAQAAAVASVATFTVGSADATFCVSANVNVTAATTANFTVTCTYTDETNASRTLTLTFSQISGTFLTAITNVTGTGPYEGVPVHIRCKAATSITIATTGTFTSVTYNVEGYIRQM